MSLRRGGETMDDERKPPSWWTTLPGILTASVGIITAVTGLIAALNQMGVLGRAQQASFKAPQTYSFSMSHLDKLAGEDCEMSTDPQDTVRVNFNSQLSHTESEVLLAVSYDATEYRGNGTKIGKQTRVTTY